MYARMGSQVTKRFFVIVVFFCCFFFVCLLLFFLIKKNVKFIYGLPTIHALMNVF